MTDAGRQTSLEVQRSLGAQLDAACEARGLIVPPLINMCVFSPPLTISQDQINDMVDIIEDAIKEVENDFAKG